MPDPKPSTPTTTAAKSVAAATPKSAPAPKKPSTPAPTKPRKAKPRYVRLRNMTSQLITCSVVNDSGRAEEIKLPARSTSHAVREDRLTRQTLVLMEKGHIRSGG